MRIMYGHRLDMGGSGDGPDWGHWVSKDFTKWAQLPVAIWNDQYYDNSAIYTGSTTIVDGKPVIMCVTMSAL